MPDRVQPRSRPCPGRRRQRRLARASVAGWEWPPRACGAARGGGRRGRGHGSTGRWLSPASHSTDPCERRPERPRCGGRDVIRVLIAEDPAMVRGALGFLRRAMETGAYGFLLKDAPPEQLAHAIRRTARGERVVDPGLAASALSEGVSPLTERERQVLAATDRGANLDEIAHTLFLSRG